MDRTARRRAAALSGHTGDIATARRLAADPDPSVRATALGALWRATDLQPADLAAALADPVPAVRRRALELWAASEVDADAAALLHDPDPSVVETAAWALGERPEAAHVPALASLATEAPDALVREAAVAALGAIGHPDGLAAILAATTDKATVRRRAVLALAPFEGPEVDAALERARSDRDWQVRQAAEDLLA